MKKIGWSFVIVNPMSFSKVRQIYISGITLISLTVIFMAGFLGMARLVWFSASYGIAKFGVYEARKESGGLQSKIKFLNKFLVKEAGKIEELVSFEDNVRLQYGMKRISSDVRQAGIGGRPDIQEDMMTILDPVLLHAEEVKASTMSLLRQAELQDSTLTQMSNQVSSLHRQWSELPSIWPTNGRITSTFGYRFHPIAGHNMFHEGIDIANKIWTPVITTADGIVEFVGIKQYFGRVIIIKHPGMNCQTFYAHLHQYAVSEGQAVKRGQLIGYMGNSGRSTGPHLHYETRVAGKQENPLGFILPSDVVID